MGTTTWDQRGREAEVPTQIPAKGWKDVLIRVKKEINEDRLSMIAAAMSYYALLAFVPAITSVVLIYAWINDPSEIVQHVSKVSHVLPQEFQEILTSQLTALAKKAPSTLGLSAIGSLLFSLWSASKGSKALIEASNILYDEREKRGFFKLNALALGLTFFATLLSIVAVGVIVGLPTLTEKIGLPDSMQALVGGVSWLILLSLFALFLGSVYRYGPCRNDAKWKWVSSGAIVASVLWALGSALFSWYATNFGDFNKTYGSLGAVVVLLTWFYLTSFAILLGGEINAELEHQTKKDTTEGAPKPLGNRNAKMADTVGESYGK